MRNEQLTVDFFLGALSPCGFTGWFAQAAQEPGVQAYLLKTGPGCGKSTFLKRVAQADNTSACIQRIHCSSDPASLDGVLLPAAGALLLDATAPHSLDCKFPGASERVVSLYDTLDNAFLKAHRTEILLLGKQNAALLQRAAAYFALACSLLQRRRACAREALDTPRLTGFGRRLAQRTMPKKEVLRPGRQQHRLLSAPTPGGPTVFYDTIPTLATELYTIHDAYGAAAPLLLSLLAEHAKTAGYDAILCHCPSDQTQIDHLFIPELHLAFLTSNTWHPMLFVDQKNIHADRWMDKAQLAKYRPALRREKSMAAELIDMTCEAQHAAKTVHDALEHYYVAATDFSAVDRVRFDLQQELFGA